MLTMTLCLLLGGLAQLSARPLSELEARKLAEQFFQSTLQAKHLVQPAQTALTLVSSPTMRTASGYELQAAGEPAHYYYVYNRGDNEGFVIIAGDDRLAPYIGYSTTGSFSVEAMPANLAAFLEACEARVDELTTQMGWERALQPTTLRSGEPETVAPLLGDILWDQMAPWNAQTPTAWNGEHMPVGCVATAYAQVMRYYKWPLKGENPVNEEGHKIPFSYKENRRTHTVDFEKATYDWDNMPASYQDGRKPTEAEIKALGTLNYHAAVAVETVFDASASGSFAPLIVRALRNNFRYDKRVTFKRRVNFTQAEWDKMLREELAAGRPLIYSGTGTGGGHAFVCDGYNDEGLYHINWGWSGQANGYFNLNYLAPGYLGVGGGAGGGFSMEQGVVIGITPDRAGTSKVEELPVLTTRKFNITVIGGEGIKVRDANYAVWLSDGIFQYQGRVTYAATKLGSTDTVYMEDYAKLAFVSKLYEQATGMDVYLDLDKYVSEGIWDFFVAYELTLPDGKKVWRPCAIDVREGKNENGKGRHTYKIEKIGGFTYKVTPDYDHPYSHIELVEGSAVSSFKAYEHSTVKVQLKNTGRGEFFKPVYLEIKHEDGEWIPYTDLLPAIPVGETQEVTFEGDRCPYAEGRLSLRLYYQTEKDADLQYFELPDATIEKPASIRPAFVIEPADKAQPMEADLSTGKISEIRITNVGTSAPTKPLRYRYTLEYGLRSSRSSWTDFQLGADGTFTVTPQLLKELGQLGAEDGETIYLTMLFQEVDADGSKHRIPLLEDPKIAIVCKSGEIVKILYKVSTEIEGEGELQFPGYTDDLQKVPQDTKLTVEPKPAEGYELTSLTVNGLDIHVSRSFVVTGDMQVKAVFSRTLSYPVTLQSNDLGKITVVDPVNLQAVPYGTTLTIQPEGNKSEYRLGSLKVNGKEIFPAMSFVVTGPTEVQATFKDHTSVEEIAAHQMRIYPNPAQDFVLLEGAPAGTTVALYTMDGKLMLQTATTTEALRIDLTQLQEGTYLLVVGDETQRLVIAR